MKQSVQLPYITPLSEEEIAAGGVPGRWLYGYADKVRFAEIDRLNHVNNLAYLQWFEVLRVRYIQMLGMTSYRDDDPQLVLRGQSADYLSPMHLNDDYIVACRVSKYRNTSFTIEYVCFASGVVKVTGASVIVLLEPDGKTKRLLPDDIVSRFRDIDGAAKV